MSDAEADGLICRPIGYVRSPYDERSSAPRQPGERDAVDGRIVLEPGHNYEHALSDLDEWRYLWVLFWFHLNEGRGWRPKVLPPRTPLKKRGVFATRSPYRPNPIGLSVVELVRVEGREIAVRGHDLVDGTPVLDIKPYLAYSDAIPEAGNGWLDAAGGDAAPHRYEVAWSERARAQLAWVRECYDVELAAAVTRVLSQGTEPHPYRRIKRDGDELRLAVKDWRFPFSVEGSRVLVREVATGYRPSELVEPSDERRVMHRAFVECWAPDLLE